MKNVSYPLSIHPVYGNMKILPRTTIEQPVDERIYDEVLSGNWFKQPQESIEYKEKKPFSFNNR